ncbi:hypothetical protein BaRGS_00014307 [Batillaria attramentaria]|uniref:Uncharacterized protein n=1 Tax=Batillaria attramentaria TaxID=370345 RepID=A0ABD0L501_9CAEN
MRAATEKLAEVTSRCTALEASNSQLRQEESTICWHRGKVIAAELTSLKTAKLAWEASNRVTCCMCRKENVQGPEAHHHQCLCLAGKHEQQFSERCVHTDLVPPAQTFGQFAVLSCGAVLHSSSCGLLLCVWGGH